MEPFCDLYRYQKITLNGCKGRPEQENQVNRKTGLSQILAKEPPYLKEYEGCILTYRIRNLRDQGIGGLLSDKLSPYRSALEALSFFKTSHILTDQAVVEIGSACELSSEQQSKWFQRALWQFIPWKKGPFKLFGKDIDSEWRSDLKWERIRKKCGPLDGRVIADIGCNNGYFMFRMAAENPQLVIGFEPYGKHLLNFQLMQGFARIPALVFEPLGVEHMNLYPDFFDRVFCLGILYHHTDPVGLLRKIRSAMKKNSELYIDCQGIPGDEPVALVPSGRYACARGVWFLPTLPALTNWIRRAGFSFVECFYNAPLSSEEQRSTLPFAPVASLKDFLQPGNPELTVEGYPAPRRFYLKVKR